MNKSHMEKRLNQLPTWLWANSTTLPPIYKMVWEAVREDKVRSNGMATDVLVDTNKVFPLLLTSQLPTDVLGHIWSLANQKYAGQLTEQELYIVLALVAAAQASYTFDSLDVLHLLPFPPTPYLNIECLMNLQPVLQSNLGSKTQICSDGKPESNIIGMDGRYVSNLKGKAEMNQEVVIFPSTSVASSTTGKVLLTGTKNCSATPIWDVNTTLRDTKQNIRTQTELKNPTTLVDPCDEFTEFQSAPVSSLSNIPIWDAKQGSAIGSRLANHNLGVKKSTEKSKKYSISGKATNINTQANITPVSLNATPASKNHVNLECISELFPKCTIRNQSKTVILKDTAIRNDDVPKKIVECSKDHPKHLVEIDRLAKNKCINSSSVNKLDWVEKVQKSVVVNSGHQDLMNLQPAEDKYSALRALGEETTSPSEPSVSINSLSQPTDEFGEFISAEQVPNITAATVNTSDDSSFSDVFSNFDFKPMNENSDKTNSNYTTDLTQSFDNLKLEETVDEGPSENGKVLQREDAISINSIEFTNSTSGALTRSGSVPSLDLKSFLPSSVEEDQISDTPHQTVYWEWKQYMESCILLLQVAADIFTNISSESVLHEVLNSAPGYNFLCNLAEVAAVCRRVNFSYKEMDINIVGFDELLMDIDRIWAEMEPFYSNIPIVTELPAWPLHQGDNISCSLCLTIITTGRVVYNENNYHVTCANLWLNCVSSHLPVMRHSFYSQSNFCSSNSHI